MSRFYLFFYILSALPLSLLGSEWVNLLDENLSHWEIYMGVPHPTVEFPDSFNGEKFKKEKRPLGLNNDPLNVFTTHEEEGETILKITGEIYAGLTTKKEYENYHFTCYYKWGEKKWEPRLNKKRDSGILIHATGEHGTFWNVWKRSLECQVQEGDTGDFIPLGAVNSDTTIHINPKNKRPVFDFDGELFNRTGYTKHYKNYELEHGQWNKVEVYTLGQTSVFVVNSQPNMVIYNSVYFDKGKRFPLSKGQIQIQSEGAEVYYKGLKIKEINSFPENLKPYIKQPNSIAKRFKRKN